MDRPIQGSVPVTRNGANNSAIDKPVNSETQKPTLTLDDLTALEALIAEYERHLKQGGAR